MTNKEERANRLRYFSGLNLHPVPVPVADRGEATGGGWMTGRVEGNK